MDVSEMGCGWVVQTELVQCVPQISVRIKNKDILQLPTLKWGCRKVVVTEFLRRNVCVEFIEASMPS